MQCAHQLEDRLARGWGKRFWQSAERETLSKACSERHVQHVHDSIHPHVAAHIGSQHPVIKVDLQLCEKLDHVPPWLHSAACITDAAANSVNGRPCLIVDVHAAWHALHIQRIIAVLPCMAGSVDLRLTGAFAHARTELGAALALVQCVERQSPRLTLTSLMLARTRRRYAITSMRKAEQPPANLSAVHQLLCNAPGIAESLRHLTLNCDDASSRHSFIQGLASFTALQSLHLNIADPVLHTEQVAQALAHLSGLTSLQLLCSQWRRFSKTNASKHLRNAITVYQAPPAPDIAGSIGQLQQLRTLALLHCTPSVLAPWPQVAKLTELRITAHSEVFKEWGRVAQALPGLPELQALILRPLLMRRPACNGAIDVKPLAEAALSCHKLTRLCLPIRGAGDDCLRPALGRLTSLSALIHFELCACGVRINSAQPKVVQSLAPLVHMSVLKLRHMRIDGRASPASDPAMCEVLRSMAQLQHLSLQGCDINDALVQHILLGVAKNAGLQSIDLSHNSIGGLGLFELAKAIVRRHRNMQRIDVRNNMSFGSSKHAEAALALLSSLPRRPLVLGLEHAKAKGASVCEVVRTLRGAQTDDTHHSEDERSESSSAADSEDDSEQEIGL